MKKIPIIALSLLAAPSVMAGEAGKLTQETWTSLPGSALQDLTSASKFFEQADQTASVDGTQVTTASSVGVRIRGYVTIPADGDYSFAIAGDDAGLLKVSLDGNKFKAQKVAEFTSWTALTNFTAQPSQIAEPITLTAGQRVFVEALLKSGGGLDGISLGWITPGATAVELIPASAVESYVFSEDANDANGDELPDHWATLPVGENGLLDDPDHDGLLNVEEAEFGTDPLQRAGVTGYLSYEKWYDVGATNVEALESLPEFRLAADSSELLAAAEAPANESNNFGARLHGFVIAPASGEYTFWVAGDDHCDLYLSANDDKLAAVKIAGFDGATYQNNFDQFATQKSETVALVAGQKYYISALMKEAGGGDNVSIAWTTPDGSRAIIPTSALESFAYSANDSDNDGMNDTWEAANGLDNTVNDALLDPDGDNAPNWLEFQAGADPQVKAAVSGGLVHELWSGIPGRFVSDLTSSSKFLQTADVKSVSTWSAGPFNWGANHGNRLRGYISPTESGNYTFWIEGNKQVEFLLSPDADKFNAESLAKTVHFNNLNGLDFDYDLAQKTRQVYLEAGQAYYVEVLHKSSDKGGDHFSFAWTKPDGTREYVPAANLSTFAGQADDLDDDGLLDSWELANGLSISDNGSVNPANGAQGDLDGDGLTNAAEQAAGTLANNTDSDGDGVSDFDEIKILETQALVGDVAPFVEIASIGGSSFTNPVGEWVNSDGKALHTSVRGSVDYTVNVSAAGVFMLDLELAPYSGASLSQDYEVVYSVDGQKLDRVIVQAAEGTTTNAKALTPYLTAGQHTVTVFLDNSYTDRKATLNYLKVLASAGTDSDSNGQPDWVDNRLAATNTVDGGALYSQTSPAFIEGKAKYLDLASASGVALHGAPGNRWFANVDLNPSGEIDPVGFNFENGGKAISKDFKWITTNLLQEERITVRQGASLRLSASESAEGNVTESVSLQIADQSFSFTADEPQIVQFFDAGEHSIDVTYTSAAGTQTKQVIVEVLADFTIAEEPVVVQGYWREWDVPALPANATLELDERLIVRDAVAQADGSTRYTLMNTGSENLSAIVRDEVTGEVLGSFDVKGLRVRDNELTDVTEIGISEDGMRFVQMKVMLDGSAEEVILNYNIFIGGVTFDDGSLNKSWGFHLQPIPLDGLTINFRKTGLWGSICHRGEIYQDGVRIAHMY